MPKKSSVESVAVRPRKFGFALEFRRDARPCGSSSSAIERALQKQIPEVRTAEVNGNRVNLRTVPGSNIDDVVPRVARVMSGMTGTQILLPERFSPG